MTQGYQDHLVRKIREEYTEKGQTDFQVLMELNRKVKKPAIIFAYSWGIIASLIMGSGMSLVMTDISRIIGLTMPVFYGIGMGIVVGIILGLIGMIMAIVTYPIYKKILNSRRKKYAEQIIAVSDKLMKGTGE